MKTTIYYTLVVLCNEANVYYIEFGDYDFNVVKQEAKDSYEHEKTYIISCIDDQKIIDAEVDKLNKEHRGY